jgi:PAS domain S-box-containing protein
MDFNISYIHFLTSLVFLTLGLIILFKDIKKALNRICSIVFLCFTIWSFSYTFIQNPLVTAKTAMIFENISSIGWIFFGPFLFWFALLYAQKIKYASSPFLLIPVFIPAGIFIYKQWTTLSLIKDHIFQPYGWLCIWQLTYWPVLFFIYYLFTCWAALIIIWKYGRKSKDVMTYHQSMILVISATVSIFGGSLSNVVFVLLKFYALPPMSDVIILTWAGSMAYAMLRYKLLSITPFIAAEQIISSMKDLLFLLDPQGKIISFNDAAKSSLELNYKELEDLSIINLFSESDNDKDKILASMQLSTKGEFETSFATKSGVLLPVSLSTSVLPGIGIVCVAHDISLQKLRNQLLLEKKSELESEVSKATKELRETNTLLRDEINERMQAVDALEESEQRLRILFEFAPDSIYLNDLSGTFVDGNRETERVTGYTKDELIGKNIILLKLLPGNQITKASRLLAKNILNRPTGPDEFTLNRKDGSQTLVEISTYPIKINDRKLILGIARDISLRKKNEDEKRLLKEELHHAQKMEAIGRLAGGIAHDFNNLLCGITGYADLLQRKLETELPHEVKTVKKIINTAKQASDLTSRLMAFARKGKYEVEIVNLHYIVEEVIDLLKRTVDKRIVFSARLLAQNPSVMGDKSQLFNALLNLAVNARDAMPEGGLITFDSTIIKIDETISRSYSYNVIPGTYIKLSVIDSGTGMDAATKEHAFEPFFTTKDSGKGTGMGLASVYGTVKNHNGFIDLLSEPGKGTIVVLYIPVTIAIIKFETVSKEFIIQNKSGKVLVVEDEPILREMASEALDSLGYSVHSCDNGTEAVNYFGTHYTEIDVVLLDLTMPGLNGGDTFRALKKINPAVRTIITSGHTLDDEIGILLQEGALFFLKKPYNLDNLSEALSLALS